MITFYNISTNPRFKVIEKAFQKGDNLAHSVCRTRRRMEEWLFYHLDNYDVYFSTFTFKEEEVNRKSFTQYLRDNNLKYCLNADYGKDYGRYHLHGFIAVPKGFNVPKHSVYDLYGYTFFTKASRTDAINYCVKYSVKLQMFNKSDRLMLTRFS